MYEGNQFHDDYEFEPAEPHNSGCLKAAIIVAGVIAALLAIGLWVTRQ